MFSTMEKRVHFDPIRQIAEFDLSHLAFSTPAIVTRVFGQFENMVGNSGHDRWYFVVNVQGTMIAPEAMSTFARRARALNSRHSLGTVRYACAPEIAALLERASQGVGFDFRHTPDRHTAETEVERLRHTPWFGPEQRRSHRFHDYFPRFNFDTHNRILDLDMSGLTLHNSRDVSDFFDHMRARIHAMGAPRRWYYLINFANFHAAPEAWVDFSRIGREICNLHALGVLRYGVSPALLEDLSSRFQNETVPVAVFETREAAIASLKASKPDS
ncbi:hypothetical protein [Sagittula sp. S175]|uniref:hypothetical protein n=1 Tax=Sagittula sp. S175 TaxID=3415129 RepID=UPI003C7BC9F6